MNHPKQISDGQHVVALNPEGQSSVVLVCEHASNFIPAPFEGLGLVGDALHSHAAWDPGAMAVATNLSERLDATLIASSVSRLVYDCNRPPSALDAMPAQSEAFKIPGNEGLTPTQRSARAAEYYEPFRTRLAEAVSSRAMPVIVTVHSFTPIYNGKERAVEIGILHDSDTRLADAMLEAAPLHTKLNVQRNAPYGPEHGVTHTLKEHAIGAGHLNVMLEVRNDLLISAAQQDHMAECIAEWLTDALARLQAREDTLCQA